MQWDNKMQEGVKMSSELVNRWSLIFYPSELLFSRLFVNHNRHLCSNWYEGEIFLRYKNRPEAKLQWRILLHIDGWCHISPLSHLWAAVFRVCCHICQIAMSLCQASCVVFVDRGVRELSKSVILEKLLPSQNSPTFCCICQITRISLFCKLLPCSHSKRTCHRHRGLSFFRCQTNTVKLK